ncbi:MAG: SDR family oxidoreductase [Bacteriovoracaceae bacterium]|nr:SDR family oxidoreductase [Bacteriovoracaceae bacterium]
MLSLTHKNVLITGGVGILGKVFVKAFLDQGANVAILDIDSVKISDFVNELKLQYSSERKIIGLKCDVTNENEVANVVSTVVKEFGRIDILHNNAVSKSSNLDKFFDPFEEFELSTWKEIMSVNIDGMFLMAKYVGKHMVEKKIKGSIIQTSSIYGLYAPDQRIYEGSNYLGRPINTPAVYSASKAAVIGLTKYLSSYWGAVGIRVNTLTPGGIESGQNETFIKNYSARVPMNRMGKADELVGALLYLASDASSYVTGQNIVVDGGLSVW